MYLLYKIKTKGKSSKNWKTAKMMLYKYPKRCKELLNIFTDATIAHLIGQSNAGCQALEIFESCAGVLAPDLFEEFVIPCLIRIYDEVKKEIKNSDKTPIILFARECNIRLDKLINKIGKERYEVYAIGWGKDAKEARHEVGYDKTLQV